MRVGIDYRRVVLSDGPSGYWRLNEGGTVARDQLGRNNGTLSGTITSRAAGATGDGDPAMNFATDTDAITISGAAIDGSGNKPFSFECWHRPAIVDATFRRILCKEPSTNHGVILLWQQTSYSINRGDAGGGVDGVGTQIPVVGVWVHLVGTYDGVNLRLYVNGSISGGAGVSSRAVDPATSSLTIGSSVNGTGGCAIDEVAVYAYALSAEQVRLHYLAGIAGAGQRSAADYSSQVLGDGPFSYWRLGESSGLLARDATGLSDGVISVGVTLGQAGALPGDPDTSMLFHNAAEAVALAKTVPVTQAMSLEAWIKTTYAADATIFSNRPSGGGGIGGIYFGQISSGGQIFGYNGDASTVSFGSTLVINDGAWHHVVWTMDGITDRLFIDGAQNASLARTHPNVAGGPAFLAFDPAFTARWPGNLDEVALYRFALTPAQVLAHYRTGLRGKARAAA